MKTQTKPNNKTVLAISKRLHTKVREEAKKNQQSVKCMADMLINYSLDKLASGQVQIVTPSLSEK
jgi:hypothetical protein